MSDYDRVIVSRSCSYSVSEIALGAESISMGNNFNVSSSRKAKKRSTPGTGPIKQLVSSNHSFVIIVNLFPMHHQERSSPVLAI